ncbi:hypothetical protein ACIQXA_35680 [Streptomyces massasporeus]|uniref:hypothetical protein n=1 Tax=Streptomyces massasporeus TaxID=67324 RepID=UPI003816EA2C
MSGGSLAFQQYQKLQVNRARQLEQMRGRLTELGDDYGLQQLDTMMADFGATGPTSPDDPIGAFLTELVQQTKDALADLGSSRAALAGVWAVALKRDAFSARMTRFTDGSGLVAVSDATFSLCQLYAQAMGLAGQLGSEPQVLAGLLRYYNTQQRVFGIAGKLEIRLEPTATQAAGLFHYLAAQFVVAHELAHYVLGHASSVSAFAPDEYLPVCAENHQLEAEADLHALRVVRRACEHLSDDLPPGGEEAALGAVGAAIGMLAVHVTEQALFVRRGTSHPPARKRAAALLREMNSEERRFAEESFGLALAATEAACSTGASAVSPLVPEDHRGLRRAPVSLTGVVPEPPRSGGPRAGRALAHGRRSARRRGRFGSCAANMGRTEEEHRRAVRSAAAADLLRPAYEAADRFHRPRDPW